MLYEVKWDEEDEEWRGYCEVLGVSISGNSSEDAEQEILEQIEEDIQALNREVKRLKEKVNDYKKDNARFCKKRNKLIRMLEDL